MSILGIQYKLGNNSFTYISHNVRVYNKLQELVKTAVDGEDILLLSNINRILCFHFDTVLADRFRFMLDDAKKRMRIEDIKLHREGNLTQDFILK